MVAAEERAEFFVGPAGVGLADSFDDLGHLFFDFEDDSLGSVLTAIGFVLPADEWKFVHDVVLSVCRRRSRDCKREPKFLL